MNQAKLLPLLLCLCFLPACETGKPLAQKKSPADSDKLSMIEISRGLSSGAVDVFETEGALLTLPQPPNGKNFGVTNVPKSSDILPIDKNVVIYDLATGKPVQTKIEVQELDDIEPVIPPIGLPDLQPPVEALGELPSPFDEKGNLREDEK